MKSNEIDDFGFLPVQMAAKLMPFQREGVKFAIGKDGRTLIGDEMGLGKTLQALSVAYYYREEWPLLVIVPSSLRYPWVEEVEKWMPEIDPSKIKLISACNDILDISQAAICIVTYGLIRFPGSKVLQEALLNQNFNIIIVDESHYLKNRKSATSKFLVPLIKQAKRKILLTGTPALARPEELFPQLDALCDQKLFGNWTAFSKRYCDARMEFFGRVRRWNTGGASNLVELQNKLTEHVMIRRLKKDVLTQLPAKQRQKIPFELKESDVKKEMDSVWKELYGIMDRGKMTINSMLAGASLTEEEAGFKIRTLISELYRKTAKVKIGPVKEYVKMLCQNAGLKFLVFAFHHVMMDSLAEQLHDEGISFIRIDGSTVQQERPRLVHQFQKDPNTRVAILSMKAAGVGLTLTAAKLVVFAELDWTPGVLEQCEDRAHRIGQQDTVHVHYLVARGTLDDWVWAALCRKTVVVTATLNGEKQVLEMDHANPGQISCLERAEAWVPPPVTTDRALTAVLHKSLTPSSQKSMLDFFRPKSAIDSLETVEPASNRKKKSNKRKAKDCSSEHIVLLDSDDDNVQFRSPKMQLRQAPLMESDEDSDDLPALCDLGKPSEGHSLSVSPVPKKKKLDTNVPESESSQLESAGQVECESQDAVMWSCQACTFFNNQMLPYCEICTSPKPPQMSLRNKHNLVKQDSWGNTQPTMDNKPKPMVNVTPKTGEKSKQTDSSVADVTPKSSKLVNRSESEMMKRTISDDLTNSKLVKTSLNDVTPKSKHADAVSKTHSTQTSNKINTPNMKSEKKHSATPKCDLTWKKTADKERLSDANKQTSDCPKPFQPRKINLTAEAKSCKQSSVKKTESSYFPKRRVSQLAASFFSAESGSSCDEDDEIYSVVQDKKCNSVRSDLDDENNDHCVSQDPLGSDVELISESEDESSEELHPETSTLNGAEKETESNICHYDTGIITGCDRGIVKLKINTDNDIVDMNNDDHSDEEDTGALGGAAAPATPKATQEMMAEEAAAASMLFSPSHRRGHMGGEWQCPACQHINDEDTQDCDGCLESRPEEPTPQPEVKERQVDLDSVPVYPIFYYKCSLNTARIYLYDQDGKALNMNFLPLDVEMENLGELPDMLLHPQNLALVKRFVRQWKSFSPTKQRIIIRSGEIFVSPQIAYDELKSGKKLSVQRYTTKFSGALAALKAAEDTGGSLRVLTRPEIPCKKSRANTDSTAADSDVVDTSTNTDTPSKSGTRNNNKTDSPLPSSTSSKDKQELEKDLQDIEKMKGIVQALDGDGNPLCVQCQKRYENELLSKETIQKNPWSTRFCSVLCAEKYWVSRYREYGKRKVYELERGVCQLCQFDAEGLYLRIKQIKDLEKRARLIQESKYSTLKAEIKEKMVKKPISGQFWQMDHITPVVDGGGECDLDNLRTLCTLCHNTVTKEQNHTRRVRRKIQKNSRLGDITAFLQK